MKIFKFLSLIIIAVIFFNMMIVNATTNLLEISFRTTETTPGGKVYINLQNLPNNIDKMNIYIKGESQYLTVEVNDIYTNNPYFIMPQNVTVYQTFDIGTLETIDFNGNKTSYIGAYDLSIGDTKLFVREYITEANVFYKTHVQDIGWQTHAINGALAGTEGQSKRLEAIQIKTTNTSEGAKIKYQVHVENIGWQEWKENGQLAGTEGKSLRLEAIRIKLENEENYSIQYRVHVQDIGWQNWKTDGAMAGTEGKSLRLEAIQIRIIPKEEKGKIIIEKDYKEKSFYNKIDVSGYKYSNIKDTKIKVFIDNTDYTDSIKIEYKKRTDLITKIDYGGEEENKEPGFSFLVDITELEVGLHSVKTELVTTDETNILSTSIKQFLVDKDVHIEYKSHVQDIGWQDYVKDGMSSGTSGRSLRVEAINLKTYNLPEGVKLRYQTHVQDIGWQGWKNEGEVAGTSGESKRVEGIKIKLENTDNYSVTYRAHVQDYGWQDWVNDGETAGTTGEAKRVEAIEIKIVDRITEKKTRICLDTQGTITNELHQVSGWIMTNESNVNLELLIDNNKVNNQFNRSADQTIYNVIKGYGGEELNPAPRATMNIDFSHYSLGNHMITLRAVSENGNIMKEASNQINIVKKIEHYKDRYGWTGTGDNLEYFRYGNGPNVFFATFCVHGFEDNWPHDGYELVDIAHQLYNRLVSMNDYGIADKWTIYIMQCVNPDGVNSGYTNYGPGRTTLTSDVGRGVDLNRCWSTGFVPITNDSRNFTGNSPFLAVESRYLRDFMINHRATNGKNVVVDLHGWTQQLIGDPDLRNYYRSQFPENYDTETYGKGYLINWARENLNAKSALIELPRNNYSHNDVVAQNLANRYMDATLSMLRGL